MGDFLIVTRGTSQRLETSNDFAATLRGAGVDATVVDVSPYSHRDVNVMLGALDETALTPVVDAFVADCT